nr:hypothetical protein [Propionibacterium sp.]
MAKVRVYELAKELGVESKELLSILKEMGEFVRSASSTIDPVVVRKVAERFRKPVSGHISASYANESSITRPHAPKPSPKLFPRTPSVDTNASRPSTRNHSDSVGTPSANAGSEVTNPQELHPLSLGLQHVSSAERSSSRSASSGSGRSDGLLASRRPGWHAGAVKPPTDARLLSHIAHLGLQFPEALPHLDALQRLGSQIVYVGKAQGAIRPVRVRFSGAIESAFGFTREVLFLYCPYADLQTKTIEEARRILERQNSFVTPDVLFISAPDPRLTWKLADWSTPNLLLVPLLPAIEEDPQALIQILRQNVYGRDLFYITTPVEGARFFGRKTLLQELRDDVRNGRVSGIYGLRKAGKTSVLLELAATSESNLLPVLVDLESFPSPPEDATDEILMHIARRLVSTLKARDFREADFPTFRFGMPITEWKYAVQATLELVSHSGLKVLLLLDEIEYLTSDKVDIEEGEMPRIAQMLAAFRGLAQESSNFTFVLSGLTSALTESGRLYGRPNPLFSWAKTYYVSPFTRAEAADLANTLGAKMGIHLDNDALRALYDGSGGHAFLYRSLASAAVGQLADDAEERRIGVAEIQRAYLPWRRSVAGHVREMLDHVKRYYGVEALLMESMMANGKLARDLVQSQPQAIHHLIQLGLMFERGNDYYLNSLLELAR